MDIEKSSAVKRKLMAFFFIFLNFKISIIIANIIDSFIKLCYNKL